MALIAWLGVRRGIPADDPADLRAGSADLPGAALSVTAIALGLYAFTLAVEDGWTATTTLACAAAAIIAGIGFVLREHRTPQPMLDLHLFANPTVRGSALLQTTSMLAMVGVVFASTQLFQFAWGWTPLRAGLATLPIVIGMLTAMPVAEASSAASATAAAPRSAARCSSQRSSCSPRPSPSATHPSPLRCS